MAKRRLKNLDETNARADALRDSFSAISQAAFQPERVALWRRTGPYVALALASVALLIAALVYRFGSAIG